MPARKLSELNDDELAAEVRRRKAANKPRTVKIREIEMDEEQYQRLHGKPKDDDETSDEDDEGSEDDDEAEDEPKKGYFKS